MLIKEHNLFERSGRRGSSPGKKGVCAAPNGMKFRWPHRNHQAAVLRRQHVLSQLPQMSEEDQRIFSWSVRPEVLAPFQECLSGEMVLPVGVVGPFAIDMGIYDRHSSGELQELTRTTENIFIPLAHTEGGLSESMLRGSHVTGMAEGIKTWVLQDEMTRDCAFVFDTANDATSLHYWILAHERELKDWINNPHHDGKMRKDGEQVARVSHHAVLLNIRTHVIGPVCHVLYGFDTQEACGPNMITRNAYALNEHIVDQTGPLNLIPGNIFLEANMGGDKKPSYEYFHGGHGKTVVAESIIPDNLIARYLHTTAEQLQALEWVGLHGAQDSGMQSFSFTPASAIAAVFAATGQDLGMVGTSSMAHATVSRVPDGVAFSITLKGLEVGTVGGGTGLPHAQSYLRMMGCEGPHSARRLAQIIAAGTLALEISAASSMASRGSENFFRAHWTRGGLR